MTHKQLVESAYKWVLKNASCGVAFKELNTINREYADVIGFGSWCHSVLIECKVSRSDFLADKNKPFRKTPEVGMGTIRYYCCPIGLIKQNELPEGWGLLYVDEGLKCKREYRPLVKGTGEDYEYKADYKHNKNIEAEHRLMYSALRRLHLRGRIDEIYNPLESYQPIVPDEEDDKCSKPN